MLLTDKQSDALAELINIAFARTAASLSELSGHRVLLNAPGVDVVPIDERKLSFGSTSRYKRTLLDWENRTWLRKTQSDVVGRAQTFVN